MVDKPKVDQMLSNLDRFVGTLGTLADSPPQTFLSNSDKIGSAKYHLVVAIECCIDVANLGSLHGHARHGTLRRFSIWPRTGFGGRS